VNGTCWIRLGVPLEPSTRAGQADKESFDALISLAKVDGHTISHSLGSQIQAR
jgi:hypothetical protein